MGTGCTNPGKPGGRGGGAHAPRRSPFRTSLHPLELLRQVFDSMASNGKIIARGFLGVHIVVSALRRGEVLFCLSKNLSLVGGGAFWWFEPDGMSTRASRTDEENTQFSKSHFSALPLQVCCEGGCRSFRLMVSLMTNNMKMNVNKKII